MVTAKNRALDQLRRFKLLQRKHEAIANDAELLMPATPSPEEESDTVSTTTCCGSFLLRAIRSCRRKRE